MSGRYDSASIGSGQDAATFAYQIFMLVLCVYALLALGASELMPLDPAVLRVLAIFDLCVCAIFMIDFFMTLYRAPNRWLYLRTWGWIDFLSSIPVIEALRIGRLARVLRILRVLRALRATRVLIGYALARRADSVFFAMAIVALTMVVFASIAMLVFEANADGNIKTAEDALWWAIATITTVGYGDRYPVTTEGRAVATVLMTAGVGLFGTLSGVVASWFLQPEIREEDRSIDALREQIEQLRALVLRLEAGGKAIGTSPDSAEH